MSDTPPETSPSFIRERDAQRADARLESQKIMVAMWSTLIDLVNNSDNTVTMFQEGIPSDLHREHGSTKNMAKAAMTGIKALIALDPVSYKEAVKIVGEPRAFPFLLEDDFFMFSDDDENEEKVHKKPRT
jgi:hypothetical protein